MTTTEPDYEQIQHDRAEQRAVDPHREREQAEVEHHIRTIRCERRAAKR